jgi:hypothetical protein
VQWRIWNARNPHGQRMMLSTGSDAHLRGGWIAQTRFDVYRKQFLEREALLDGAGLYLLEQGVGEIECRSHGASLASRCKSV